MTPSRGIFFQGDTLRVAVCGSTERTVRCAETLRQNPHFQISWVVTPSPRPIGRKQILTPNPLEVWARQHDFSVISVEKSLRPLEQTLKEQAIVDFLLVVDFGYLVPPWLLELPEIAPINIHPSDLPKFRGSSPGQYTILYGEPNSAVCVMRMSEGLDEGPIIARLPFALDVRETAASYYEKAFALVSSQLADILINYAENRSETPQPEQSTTPVAKRFSREDGYISYSSIRAVEKGEEIPLSGREALSPILQEVLELQPETSAAVLVERAVRALSPWPGMWTLVPEYKGRENVRQKILASRVSESGKLVIDRSQYEGESPSP